MVTTALRGLTVEQKRQAERDGFFIARGLVSPGEVEQIKLTFMTAAANGPVEGLSEMRSGVNAEFDASDPLRFYPRMMHPHRHTSLPVGQMALRYMLDGRIYPILHDLLDDEPIAVQSMFYFKPPGARGQALHQDNYYLRVAPKTCMAAWFAVDDADPENGGMVVVPGSSHMDLVCPEKADTTRSFTTECVPVPPGLKEVPTNLKTGDVLFFNGSLIHGSYPNTSKDRFRRALICHYVPRSATEMSKWYQDKRTFDGEMVQFAEATGGGPCGTPQTAAAALH